jgi:hypothetical protein
MRQPFSLRAPFVIAAASIALSGVSVAQNRIEAATQQMEKPNLGQRLQTPASQEISGLYEDEDKDVGPQMIVHQKPRHRWLEASTDIQIGSTSNATLVESGQTETSLMTSTVQLALTPPAWKLSSGELSARAGYRHQKYNYGIATRGAESSINDADFDISTFFVQGRYLYQEKWVIALGLDHNRLLAADGGTYAEFYTEFAPSLSLQRSFEVTPKSAITANIGTTGHIAHVDGPYTAPDAYDRADEYLTLTYVRELFQGAAFQSYYRVQLTQYAAQDRKDIVQTVGLVLSYSLTNEISLRTTASFEARESNDTLVADYLKVDTGLGVSLRVQF